METDHFSEQIAERKILIKWIEAVMENPDNYALSNTSGYYIYDGYIEGYEKPLRVVVDEEAEMLITAYFMS